MEVKFQKLNDTLPFDQSTVYPKKQLATGTVNIKANININIDTGVIAISNDNGKIQFKFTNKDLARKWADAR